MATLPFVRSYYGYGSQPGALPGSPYSDPRYPPPTGTRPAAPPAVFPPPAPGGGRAASPYTGSGVVMQDGKLTLQPLKTTTSYPSLGDWEHTDPVLAQILAADQVSLGQATGAALAARKSALLGFGSQEIARKVLASLYPGADESAFIGTISDNPDTSMSTLAQIAYANRAKVASEEDAMNKDNLFYSGYRVKHLGELEHERQSNVAEATTALQSALAQIAQQLLDAQNQARQQDAQAKADAYNRALEWALAHPSTTTSGADLVPGDTHPFAPQYPTGVKALPGAFGPLTSLYGTLAHK